ncbi:MAG: hypothetical protein K0Q68_758 [Moraxellaceae bacterium]|jgi:hypothetical protein|nr:hypothetical protein [Moraxellaceae bacterium]
MRRWWSGLLLLPALAGAVPLPSPVSLMLAQKGMVAPATFDPASATTAASPAAEALAEGSQARLERAELKVLRSRQWAAGVILAWGLLQWDYGSRPIHFRSEGWFGQSTPEGGADKLGHLYTGYLLARGMASLYRDWGLAADRAAREAALTSVLVTTVMEVGDGFSPYGISGEDLLMNLAGAWAGEALARSPAWRERLDLRVEYRFNADTSDFTTDYEHARHLVALKLGGFDALRDTPLRWLEVQGGYYTRGYSDPRAPDRRTAYAGVGLNLPLLLRRARQERTATFLQFYQPPGTTLRLEDRL